MGDKDTQIQDILCGLRDPTILVPPLFDEKETIEKIPDVHKEYSIGLIVGEDLTGGALSWREYKFTHNIQLLWLFIVCFEFVELGSPFINVSKTQSPIAYEATVGSLARQFLSMADATDRTRIKYNVKNSHFINKTQLQDIQEAFESEKKKEKEKEEKKLKPTKKKKKTGEDDDEEQEEEPVKELHQEVAVDFDTLLREFSESNVPVCINEKGPFNNHLKSSTGLDKEVFLVPTISEHVSPKASFTVTRVPALEDDKKTIGYLIRIFQHDPRWNPGEMVLKLISQCEERDRAKDVRGYKEPWPHYLHLQGGNFIVHDMSLGRWFEIINNAKGGVRPDFQGTIDQFAQVHRIDVYDSENHPFSVCQLKDCLERFERAGGDVGNLREYCGGEPTARWPDHLDVFRYFPTHVFWDHNKYVGLSTQYFPKAIDAKYYFGDDMCAFLNRSQLIERREIIHKSAHSIGFRTNNMFIYYAAEADEMELKLAKAPKEKYADTLREINTVCMRKFKSIMQLEGIPTYLPIPRAIKACIVWYQQFSKTHKTLSLNTEIYDPSLDLYSNHVIRTLFIYNDCGKMLSPHILRLLHGVLSVYARRKGLALNFAMFGPPGDGKSSILDLLADLSIDETFEIISRLTDASDQTDISVHDEIRGVHEADDAFLDEKAAAKNPNKVNMKKTALDGKTSVKRHKKINISGVGEIDGFHLSKQATEYSEIILSNKHPQEGTALYSRYYNILLIRSSIPFEEYKHKVVPEKRQLIKDMFRINQFLSMMIYKAMMVFAIPCREPFMRPFLDVSARICEALRDWGIINEEFIAGRTIDYMLKAATQKVIERGALVTWHMPGAIHYGKSFKEEQLMDVAPVLYCTENITLDTWTEYSSDVVKPEFESVLNASARFILNRRYDTSKTPLQYYFEDHQGTISWKRDRNPLFQRGGRDEKNAWIIDLNYFELRGSLAEVASQIAALTENPKLRKEVVVEVLQSMARRPFIPRVGSRNGYHRSLCMGTLEQSHRGILMNKVKLCLNDFPNAIRVLAMEVAPTLVYSLLQQVIGLDPFAYKTYQQGHDLLKTILDDIDVVFTHVMIKGGYNREPIDGLMALQRLSHASREYTSTETEKILSCFTFKEGEERKIPPSMTFKVGLLVLHFLSEGKILHPSSPKSTYLLRPKVYDDNKYPHYSVEEDVAMLGNTPYGEIGKNAIHIVDLSNKNRVCISPLAIEQFNKNIIIEAFNFVTICKTTRPGKRLLSWVEEADPTKLKTMTLSKDVIKQTIETIDKNALPGAVSRQNGITFKRREFNLREERVFLYGIDNVRDEDCETALEIIENLDDWSAQQQHKICGRPDSEPVRTEAWLRSRYKGSVGKINYPQGIISEKNKKAETMWNLNSVSSYKNSRESVKNIGIDNKK